MEETLPSAPKFGRQFFVNGGMARHKGLYSSEMGARRRFSPVTGLPID
jgi:hypothetical protein